MYGMGMMGMNPMMGMGMGMGMPGMMPYGPYNPRQIPGFFGRDVLGREFSGPGGAGHSTPWRPPQDPTKLPSMPSGLPIPARPAREGFDVYGRRKPPPLPEGMDAWGRPTDPQQQAQHPFQHPGMPGIPGMPNHLGMSGMMPPPGGPQLVPSPLPHPQDSQPTPPPSQALAPTVAAPSVAGHRDPGHSHHHRHHHHHQQHHHNHHPTETDTDLGQISQSGRPEEPPMFHREPIRDEVNDYRDFSPFSFPSYALAQIHRLRRPPELKHCDVRSDEWAYFIEALEQEAYRFADKSYLSTKGTYHQDDVPLLTEDVHQFLRAWQVGYFGPRGVKIFPAHEGKRLFPPGIPATTHKGWGKETALTVVGGPGTVGGMTSSQTVMGDLHSSTSYSSDEVSDDELSPHRNKARERIKRDRAKRRRARQAKLNRSKLDGAVEDWEVCFEWTHPTVWRAGMKPLKWGEKRPAIERPAEYA